MLDLKSCWLFLAFLFLSLSLVSPCLAGQKLVLTLEKSIEIALEKNQAVLSAKEEVEAAKGKVTEARAGMLPQLSVQWLYLPDRLEKVRTTELPKEWGGGSVEMDFTKDHQISLNLTQPLFISGRIWRSYEQANLGLEIAKEKYRQTQQEVTYNVKKSFYGYLLAKESVKVAQEAISLAQKHLETAKHRYEEGKASKFDLLRAEVELANLKPQLIRAQNGLEMAELGLKNVLGLDLSVSVELKGEFIYQPYEIDLKECIIAALEDRPELRQLKHQEELAEATVKLAKASNNPSITFGANYNLIANKFAVDRDRWEGSYSGNIVLTLPLFDGLATRGKVQQAKSGLNQVELAKEQLTETIKLEVTRAYLGLMEARQIITSTSKNVEQAQDGLSIAEESYTAGVMTSLEVMDAQLALTRAKTNYIQALHDYMLAQAKLEKAMGK